MKIGGAFVVINNDIGSKVQGASVNQVVDYIRDDLEANAFYFESESENVLIISCDLAILETDRVVQYRDAIAAKTGLDSRSVLINCTHTHAGPCVFPSSYFKNRDDDYLDRLCDWLVEVSEKAIASAVDVKVAVEQGETQIGYNRRVCWEGGTRTMHGDLNREDCIGSEGPVDPEHFTVLFEDDAGQLTGILYNNTTHTTSFYGANFLSADYCGHVRDYLRKEYGDIPIVYCNGAFGDIALEHQGGYRKDTQEGKCARVAHLLTGQIFRHIHEATFTDDVELKHAYSDIDIPIRFADPDAVAAGRELLARVDAGEEIGQWDIMNAHGTVLLQDRYEGIDIDTLAIHAVKIGDFVLVTQPTELYCCYGLDIKRRSPFPKTAVSSVTDGFAGYCPTPAAIRGGGYSADAYYWTRLAAEAGDMIVDEACRLLNRLK